jgi:polyhydroxybutyrate depolymerase
LGGTFAAVAVATALAACGNAPPAAARPNPAAYSTSRTDGCGQPAKPGTSTLTLASDGRQRIVQLHVPQEYPLGKPVPLVLNLHGSGSTAARQAAASGLDATADRHTFLVAYPEGDWRAGGGFTWNIPGTPTWSARSPDDVAFLGQVVAQLRQRYCVDPARVYAVGFSGGARLASQLACEPDQPYAAVAAVGGLRAPSPCPTPAIAVLGVHGTADAQNPYSGHGQTYWTYSVPEAARRWAVHNGCAKIPATGSPYPGVTVTAYHTCQAGAAVELYTLVGRPHLWPAAKAGGLDCDEVIWRFFAAHPQPAAG